MNYRDTTLDVLIGKTIRAIYYSTANGDIIFDTDQGVFSANCEGD